jgi:hypothetical protein
MPPIKRSKLDKIVQEEVKKALIEEGFFSKSTLDKEVEKVKREPDALNVGKRVKKESGKVFSSELIDNRLQAAGFDLQTGYTKKIKEIIHQFFLDYLENKKIPSGQIEISALKEYRFEEEAQLSLLKNLAAVPRIDGDRAPASVLRALIKDVEQQLAANAAIFDRYEQPEEETEAETEEEAPPEAEIVPDEETAAPEEEDTQAYDLKQALGLLAADKFDVKDYIRKLTMYKKSSLQGIGSWVDRAIGADAQKLSKMPRALRDEATETLLKINKQFEERGLKPLEDAFDNAIEVLKNFYVKGGSTDQLKESLDYSELTGDGREVLLICLSSHIGAQPQTLRENYTRRNHLIGDKLMKKWNLNS